MSDRGPSSAELGIPEPKTPDYVQNNQNHGVGPKAPSTNRLPWIRRTAIATGLAVGGLLGLNGPLNAPKPASTDTGRIPNQPGETQALKPTETATPTEKTPQNPWQMEMGQKLDTLSGLNKEKGEAFVNGAKIISLGDGSLGVNIRAFTSNVYTPGLNNDGLGVPVLAILKPGAKINGISITTPGSIHNFKTGKDSDVTFGVFKAGNVQGEFVDDSGNPVHLDPDMVVSAAEPYFQPGTPPAPQTRPQ
jgi:hypothetical protein